MNTRICRGTTLDDPENGTAYTQACLWQRHKPLKFHSAKISYVVQILKGVSGHQYLLQEANKSKVVCILSAICLSIELRPETLMCLE